MTKKPQHERLLDRVVPRAERPNGKSLRSCSSRRSARTAPAGLSKWIALTIREARGYLRHAESEGQSFAASFHDGKIAALIDLREWLSAPKTKRARARNAPVSDRERKDVQ